MSRGDLQEMEVGTKQSKTAVNANAKAADAMPKLSGNLPDGQTGSWEDLGGPDPSNYRSTDDSAKLKTPGATLKQVKNVVNKGAKAAEAMTGMKEEDEVEYDEDEELLEASEKEDEESDKDEKEDKKEYGKKNPKKSQEDDSEDGDEDEDKMKKEEFDIEEDVNALLDGESLSEEFQEKARTIFEAALRSKVLDIKEELEIQYSEALAEEISQLLYHLQVLMLARQISVADVYRYL